MSDFILRQATEADCDEIARLIMELAVYERMPEQCKMTPEVLRKDGFGEHKYFHCVVAESQDHAQRGTLLGFALYFFAYSTWEGKMLYLEDLYVSEQHRGKGMGIALWKSVAKVAVETGCSRMQYAVLSWNTSSIDFYIKHGAVNLTEKDGWQLFRVEGEALERLAKE